MVLVARSGEGVTPREVPPMVLVARSGEGVTPREVPPMVLVARSGEGARPREVSLVVLASSAGDGVGRGWCAGARGASDVLTVNSRFGWTVPPWILLVRGRDVLVGDVELVEFDCELSLSTRHGSSLFRRAVREDAVLVVL